MEYFTYVSNDVLWTLITIRISGNMTVGMITSGSAGIMSILRNNAWLYWNIAILCVNIESMWHTWQRGVFAEYFEVLSFKILETARVETFICTENPGAKI